MSEPSTPVDLVLLWHHHQPDYRSPVDGHALLPWARLHATKDYLDMARRLEHRPGVRVTFNLVPGLLDQLEDAAGGGPDQLFALLERPIGSLTPEERRRVTIRCRQAPPRAIERWPAARALRARAPGAAGGSGAGANAGAALGETDLLQLEIWFLLAWVDPMFHGEPEAAAALADHPRWSERHRDGLLVLHRRLIGQVIPAYRALAERGQVELSTSPYHHPILPLLVGPECAQRARPGLAIPAERMAAAADARWHIERALDRHRECFGTRPAGMWPSEGSVSPEAVALAAGCGVRWLASDQEVLARSLPEHERQPDSHYRPWRFASDGGEVGLFFRDRELSDRIGFLYHRWEPADAAADFVARLRRIGREHAGGRPPVVPVILDGENCWEHYADDGGPFLEALYDALATSPDVRTRTPSELLVEWTDAPTLARLHSGSWIDADFHIWIGHPEKNRAWDLLARTRRAMVEAGATPERAPEAWQALYRAEGSDWFWWFGDDHHTADLAVFDRLFRDLLAAAHERAGLTPPASLRLPVARAHAAAGPEAIPIGFIHPTLDGRRTTYYEWHAAARVVAGSGSAMHRGPTWVREVHYGFDAECFYLRLDLSGGPPGEDVDLRVEIIEPRPVSFSVRGLVAGERTVGHGPGRDDGPTVTGAACRIAELVELGVPFASVGLAPGEPVALLIQAVRGGQPVESYPDEQGIAFTVPDADFEDSMWDA